MQVHILKLLIIAISIASAVGIHCYDCNSKFEEQCKDPFNRFPLANLNCDNKPMHSNNSDTPATFCRKVYQKVQEEVRIIRSCGYISDGDKKGGCRKSNPSKGVELLTCECFEDLCNGSPQQRANLIIAVSIFTIFAVSMTYLS